MRESWLQVAGLFAAPPTFGQPVAFFMKLLNALQYAAPVESTQSLGVATLLVGVERNVNPPLMLGRKWFGEL